QTFPTQPHELYDTTACVACPDPGPCKSDAAMSMVAFIQELNAMNYTGRQSNNWSSISVVEPDFMMIL
nr:hypothetical protein [Candidatus Dadabacteria bacterium]